VSISSSKATICRVDASAVRAADRHVLVGYAAAIAGNARDLLGDAEVLLSAGRWARAHSLAVLASEEWAKAYAVLTLSFMPLEVRARVSVREFLVDGAQPGVAERVAGMAGLADMLRAAERHASDANAAKQRGLYADLLADGTLSQPSDISGDEAAAAVVQAQQVGAAAFLLHDPDALAAFADPSPEAVALAETVFGPWTDAEGVISDADAAAKMLRDLASAIATS
jgi:AbiV family abortive infection protein